MRAPTPSDTLGALRLGQVTRTERPEVLTTLVGWTAERIEGARADGLI